MMNLRYKSYGSIVSSLLFMSTILILLDSSPVSTTETEPTLLSNSGDYNRVERMLSSILRSAPTGIGVVEDRVLVEVNDYILHLTGYSREELIGQSARMLYPTPEDYDYVGTEKYRQISKKGTGSVETRWQHKDGSIRHVILSSTPLDPDDHSVGVTFTVMDITDRKIAETALHESETRLLKLFQSSPGPLVVSEIDTGRFIDVNESWVEMLGYSKEEQIGRTSKEVGIWVIPEERDRIVEKLKDQGFFKDEKIQFRTQSGEIKYALWSAEVISLDGRDVLLSLIRDETDRIKAETALATRTRWFMAGLLGLIVILLGLIVWLTASLRQRQLAAAALNESKEFLATTLQSIGDGVITTDIHGLVLLMNPVAEQLCGWTLNEAKGKPLTDVFHILNSDTREVIENPVKTVLASGRIVGLANHTMLLSRDGAEYQIADSAAPIRNREGIITGVVLVFSDETEKFYAEKSLKDSEITYREIFNGINDTIWIHDIETGQFVDVNSKVMEMFGYTVQEALQLELDDISSRIPPYNQQNAMKRFEQVIQKGTQVFEWQCKHKNGQLFWTEVTLQRASINGIERIIAIERDVTDRKQAEEALRMKSEELEIYFNFSLDLLCIANTNGQLIRLNPEWEKTLGYSIHELEGRQFFDFIHPDDIESTVAAVSQLENQEDVLSFVNRYRHQDGSYRWIEWRSRPQGKNIYAAARDITDRKLAEAQLREKTDLLQNITDHMFDMVAITDLAGVFTYAGPSHRILGFEPEQFIGTSVFDYVHSDDTEYIAAEFREFMSNPTPETTRTVEYRQRCADGSYLWLETKGKILFSDKGTPSSLFFSSRDITERKRAEEALRQSEERLGLAMAVKNEGVWDWNLVTNETYFDERYYTMAGYADSEFPQNFAGWSEHVHPDDLPGADAAIKAYLAGQSDRYEIEFRWKRKDGSWMWIQGRGKIVERDESGAPLRMIGTHTDITKRKQAEEDKEKLQTQLTQAQKMESIGRLAGGVAHDFNNMLNVILGHVDLALQELTHDNPLSADLEEIQKAAQRSADLTRQLLAFARKQTVAPKVLDLNDAVESMLKMLRRLIGEDIDLAWLPGQNLGPVLIDPSQVDQILANLSVNARDAIVGVGRITIETNNFAFDDEYCNRHKGFFPGKYVLLAVSDNGCGMDRETLSHIFEPFFTSKGIGKGTGLGLATVYGIVKQNHGFINVYSEPGQGTTFRIYFPRHDTDVTEPIPEKMPVQMTTKNNETILLVEDEPAILSVAERILQTLGYTVLSANTPSEAIQIADEYAGQIHLLMTDVIMPEMNGRDLANTLLTLDPEMKQLYMSGYTSNVITHQGVLDRGVHFLQKPFSMADLAAKVRKALET